MEGSVGKYLENEKRWVWGEFFGVGARSFFRGERRVLEKHEYNESRSKVFWGELVVIFLPQIRRFY